MLVLRATTGHRPVSLEAPEVQLHDMVTWLMRRKKLLLGHRKQTELNKN